MARVSVHKGRVSQVAARVPPAHVAQQAVSESYPLWANFALQPRWPGAQHQPFLASANSMWRYRLASGALADIGQGKTALCLHVAQLSPSLSTHPGTSSHSVADPGDEGAGITFGPVEGWHSQIPSVVSGSD